jgi:hypothetical protein
MHKSLTLRANITFSLLWAGLLVAMLAMNWPQSLIPVALTFMLGVIAGGLQVRALDASAQKFREAKSAAQVRQALVSTRAGKVSVALLWAVGIGALIWAFVSSPHSPLVLWVPAYASFALARELVALPAIVRLGALA